MWRIRSSTNARCAMGSVQGPGKNRVTSGSRSMAMHASRSFMPRGRSISRGVRKAGGWVGMDLSADIAKGFGYSIYHRKRSFLVSGMKSTDALDLITMLPLMAAERPQSDIGRPFRLQSEFRPAGDQPQAIEELCQGITVGEREQVLLGVTGSGKTFTMAHVIERTGRPAIILAPNKTLAAQLYGEMKSFFPENAVEYFVSYYDYYQPEAYVPRTDTYVEKESSLNEQIDRMRHSATRAILERRDVIVVASVSCIYGIGSAETYSAMTQSLAVGSRINRGKLLSALVELQYRRNDHSFFRGNFRVRGDTIELFPAHYEDRAWRVSLFGDEIEAIHEIDPLTGEKTAALHSIKVYANSHYVTPRPTLLQAIEQIKRDLKIRLDELHAWGKLLEPHALRDGAPSAI